MYQVVQAHDRPLTLTKGPPPGDHLGYISFMGMLSLGLGLYLPHCFACTGGRHGNVNIVSGGSYRNCVSGIQKNVALLSY